MTPHTLTGFLASAARALRPEGLFIVRDQDVRDENMRALVSLAHTVFNAGLGESWESNQRELRHFAAIEHWSSSLDRAGFDDSGHWLLQFNDPTANTLLCFVRRAADACSRSAP
ncbi:hypothetical protein [Chromobacterium alticapitis]|uniref:Uncharacterized protein n=1 Tax=Chromobacterium alticapitis TaxID=2073169 RepID=A0A2S5DIN1_9NEIS|nr:hypothetical protein [Chromobacterium alticapitis]POZ62897.1 hypothetical protein C2I19_05800 [Chromobacterium alticapitis]